MAGVCVRGMHGRGCALQGGYVWQEAYMAGGMHWGGHLWRGVHGGHAWQGGHAW